MSQGCIVAVYATFMDAKDAIQALELSGIPPSNISFITNSTGPDLDSIAELRFGDEAENRGAIGAGVGGALGLLLSAPLVAVPGVGSLVIAGPVVAAAGVTGALVGGFLGTMTGWGVHSDHVAIYEEKVKNGNLLVVTNGDPEEIARAKTILDGTKALEVHLHIQTSADAPEIDGMGPVR